MLILFDIDMTLLKTNGAGRVAMAAAGASLFGHAFSIERVDFAGRLDPLILRDLLTLNGESASVENMARMKTAYIEAFMEHSAGKIEPLPGALELVDAIAGHAGATAGLLTGNFAETGTHKVASVGIDPGLFRITAWGDDSPHDPPAREHLPPVAMGRYRDLLGMDATETVILGDTVHDVACGLANGCRVLGVATGRTDAATLAAAGAHRVVDSLSDTADLAGWLLGGR